MIDTDKMKALAHRVLDTMDQPDNEAFERARYQYRAATHPERILELLAALEAAAAYKRDAERYRLLRRGQKWSVVNGIGETLRAEQLDDAIDAQLSQRQEEGS